MAAPGFNILSNAQQSANEKIQGLMNKLPTRDAFPLAEPLADLRGSLPHAENIKKEFTPPEIEEEEKDDIPKEEVVDEETGETRKLTASELWMQENFPIEHRNEGFIFHLDLSSGFPEDKSFKIAVGNPDGRWSTKIKKRPKRSQRKKYGDYEWVFNNPTKKFLVTPHFDKDWPSYINKIERRAKLIPTYSGPPLSDYEPSPDSPVPESKENISGGIEYTYVAEILGTSTVQITVSNNAGLREFTQLYAGTFNGADNIEEAKTNALEAIKKQMDMFGHFHEFLNERGGIEEQINYPKTGSPIEGQAPDTPPPPPPEGTSGTPTETGQDPSSDEVESNDLEQPAATPEETVPPEVKVKEEKYIEIKEQINTTEEKVNNMNGELLKTSTECTSVLALGTSMIGISSVLEKISGVLDKGAKAGEGITKTMKATYPSHPGPGNLNVADTTRSTDDMRNEANGFAANLGQQLSNLGDFLKLIIDKIKAFLKLIMPILKALAAIIALIAFLKQLLEINFLGFLKKSSSSNQGENQANQAEDPSEFLASIGYPGYEDKNIKPKDKDGNTLLPEDETKLQQEQQEQQDKVKTQTVELIKGVEAQLQSTVDVSESLLDKVRKETAPPPTINSSDLDESITPGKEEPTQDIEEGINNVVDGGSKTPHIDNLGLSDDTEKDRTSETEPLIIGGKQIGKPVADKTLNLTNHSILGDISNIHPQIVNELYEEGIIPKEIKPEFKEIESIQGVPNTSTFQEALNGYYNNVLDDLQNTNQIEYIQKIYNAKFEYVGYKRYKA
tara:strand:+ start:180 stop:2540 length:2361 start_codon:yes stop_codon:yes gene_type:complete